MDDDLDLQTMQENFDLIPEEVQEYIYSAEFKNSFEKLCTELAIEGEQKSLLNGAIFGFLGQNISEDELSEQINDSTADTAKRAKINDWIKFNVTKRILAILVEAYANSDDDEEEASVVSEAPAATPADISPSLTTLADRLKKNSIAAPTQKRETALDPYHEPIDN